MAKEVQYKKLADAKKPCCTFRIVCLSILIAVLAIAASGFLFVGIGGSCCFPLHASCHAEWTFQKPCKEVESALVNQIKKWETADNCANGGEKCLYKVISQTVDELKATHETPKKHYVDNMTFTFKQNGVTCDVKGYSTSQTWYAVLDFGTNYCNLHNLVTGAGLDKVPGYTETANDKTCTQYSSADCEVY